jgi:hypothetical protein
VGGVEDVLRQALDPILRDLRAAAVVSERIEDSDWTGDPDRPAAMLWGVDGGGRGIAVARSETDVERIASMADQVQEWAIEELWGVGASTNWPCCPLHPDSHPMQAVARSDGTWWTCPAGQTAIALIGAL